MKRGKCISVLRVLANANLDFVMEKDSRAVKIIMEDTQVFRLFTNIKREEK